MKRVYGCLKSDEDEKRYYEYKKPSASVRNSVVQCVDLRPISPSVQDQGDIGSCVSHGVLYGHAMVFSDSEHQDIGSRLYNYFNGRKIEGRTQFDSGMQIINGIKALMKDGTVNENLWPYQTENFKIQPPEEVYQAALHHNLRTTQIPQYLFNIQSTLIEGIPIICGLLLYESFESDLVTKTGVVPMPNIYTEKIVGLHCVVIVGFDNKTQKFIMRNSWSSNWGDQGYFYIHYNYILDPHLCSDLFCITKSY